MGKLADQMRSDLVLRGFASKTINEYLRYAGLFVKFHGKPPAALGEPEVRAFLLHEIEVRGVEPNSTRVAVAALKFLYNVTLSRPEVVVRIPFPKSPKRLPDVPSAEDVLALIDAAPSTMTRALLMLGYGSGLRISEACSVCASHVDSQRKVLKVAGGKGAKDRLTLLPTPLLEALRQLWRETRPPGEWLFPGPKGRPLSKTAVTRRFKEALAAAGVKRKMTFHSLRHAFATHLLEGGVDVVTIQALLGHANIGTTMRYLRVRTTHIQSVQSPLERLFTAKRRRPRGKKK
jgi:site-specific recombinase XerD